MVIEIKREAPQKSTAAKQSRTSRRASANESAPVDAPPKPKRAPNGTFNRTEYQRLYMQAKREMALAGVEGMTVKQWRDSKR